MRGTARVLLTLALGLATFMQVLDTSIANVSIPSIAVDLDAKPNQGTWIITAFIASNAIAMPLTGWLSRRFGEVRLFVWSTLLFTFASLLCGLAPNLGSLVAARVIQGAVAGPMIPLSQSLLVRNYPVERRAFGLATWSTVAIVAPILGPIVGGWITDNFHWSLIFYINLPIGLLAALMIRYLLRDRETQKTRQPLDRTGLLLLVAAVGASQVMFGQGKDLAWFDSSIIVGLAVVALLALVLFVVRELTVPYPVVDLHLFNGRNFLIGTLALSLGYAVYFANLVILPLWLQTYMGYSATDAGLVTAPIGLLPLLLCTVLAGHMRRFDLRLWGAASFFIFAATFYWCGHFDLEVAASEIVLVRLLQGLAITMFFVPLTTLAIDGLPSQLMASASGLITFTRYIGASIGVAVSITYWEHRAAYHHTALHASNDLSIPDQDVLQQAVMLATNDFFNFSAAIFVALVLLVCLASPTKTASE